MHSAVCYYIDVQCMLCKQAVCTFHEQYSKVVSTVCVVASRLLLVYSGNLLILQCVCC